MRRLPNADALQADHRGLAHDQQSVAAPESGSEQEQGQQVKYVFFCHRVPPFLMIGYTPLLFIRFGMRYITA